MRQKFRKTIKIMRESMGVFLVEGDEDFFGENLSYFSTKVNCRVNR